MKIAELSSEERNNALKKIAELLDKERNELIKANEKGKVGELTEKRVPVALERKLFQHSTRVGQEVCSCCLQNPSAPVLEGEGIAVLYNSQVRLGILVHHKVIVID